MTFANPIFLWGLLAVPLPILLHLFFRRRKAKVVFSTLQFFHLRERFLAHRRRLREFILLLIRTLALLCLALALARPLFTRMPFSLASRTNAVIVLDDTLSMDRKTGSGATAFEIAVQKADEILDTLSEGDGAALVFLSGHPGVALTRKIQVIRQRLQEARVTGATGSFGSALKEADAHLSAEGNPNREVFVLSDFQRNQMPARPLALDHAKGLRLYLLPVSGATDNLSVSAIKLSTRPQMVNRPLVVPYRIRNSGTADREAEVRLLVADEPRATSTLTAPAGQTVDGRFEFVPDRAGILNGAVCVADRNVALDNRRVFAVNVCENINALFLESDILSRVRPFHFLKLAVDPSDGNAANGIAVETGFVPELTPKDLEKHHVAVLANPTPLSAATASLLAHHLSAGGALIVFGGDNVDRPTFAAWPDPRLANLYGARQTLDLAGATLKGPFQGLNAILHLDLVKWQHLNALTPSPSATVLAETHGRPLIVEEKVGAGTFVACAFSCRRDSGNWPELKSFPVAMIHLLTYAAQDPQPRADVACGGTVRFSALDSDDRPLSLRLPDGSAARIPVRKGEAAFSDTGQPGILTAERARPRCVTFNPVPDESDLACLPPSKIADLVESGLGGASPAVSVLKTDAQIDSQVRAFRRGSDLTGIFLFLALLLLVLELLVGNAYLLAGRGRGGPVIRRLEDTP